MAYLVSSMLLLASVLPSTQGTSFSCIIPAPLDRSHICCNKIPMEIPAEILNLGKEYARCCDGRVININEDCPGDVDKEIPEEKDWSYAGSTGPQYWKTNFPTCGSNKRQSPINVDFNQMQISPNLAFVDFWEYYRTELNVTMRNIKASLEVEIPTNDRLAIQLDKNGSFYDLIQFHWHWSQEDDTGSEHAINGRRYPMELHLVHLKRGLTLDEALASDDGLAVVGVLYELEKPGSSEYLDRLIPYLSQVQAPGSETILPAVQVSELLPENHLKFARYHGSLTTPPCSESVIWTVMLDTKPISSQLLEAFRKLEEVPGEPIKTNVRPLQKLAAGSIVYLRT